MQDVSPPAQYDEVNLSDPVNLSEAKVLDYGHLSTRDISPTAQYDDVNLSDPVNLSEAKVLDNGHLSTRDISPTAQYDEGNPYCIFRFSTGRNLKRAGEEPCEALTPSLR